MADTGPIPSTAGPGPGQTIYRGVSLLARSDAGPVAVLGLALVFDADAVSVLRPSGTLAASMPWGAVDGLAVVERRHPPSRPGGLVLDVTAGGSPHRFLVPCSDPAAAEQVVAGWTQAYPWVVTSAGLATGMAPSGTAGTDATAAAPRGADTAATDVRSGTADIGVTQPWPGTAAGPTPGGPDAGGPEAAGPDTVWPEGDAGSEFFAEPLDVVDEDAGVVTPWTLRRSVTTPFIVTVLITIAVLAAIVVVLAMVL